MHTVEDLRAKLVALQVERDSIYRELVPKAQVGADRAVRWRDLDLAAWLGVSVDRVRTQIVRRLTGDKGEFLVDEACRVALLDISQVVTLTSDGDFRPDRLAEADYLAAQISLTEFRLAELERG